MAGEGGKEEVIALPLNYCEKGGREEGGQNYVYIKDLTDFHKSQNIVITERA